MYPDIRHVDVSLLGSQSLTFLSGGIRYIGFSPDGEMIAFAGDEQAIHIVSLTLFQMPVLKLIAIRYLCTRAS
jgi:hypothetical protein